MTEKILLVGAGNMGFAMLKGWVSSTQPPVVTVIDPSEAHQKRAEALGVLAHGDTADLSGSENYDLIVLAVKPQYISDVLQTYRDFINPGTTIVSVAAGVTIETMARVLAADAAIIRCMPNTPAAIGQGMMVLCANQNVSSEACALAERLFETSGKVAWIADENLMDAVTAISGSGPAYVFHFVEVLTQAGIDLGLPVDIADVLAKQTVAGAGQMVAQASETPAKLRENVTSPNGTTQAALEVLMHDNSFGNLLGQAAEAARDRGVELGQSN